MKSLLESINESRLRSTLYAIKFVAGKYKDSYLGGDGVGYVVADLNFQDNYSHKAIIYSDVNNAVEALEEFNRWSKGSWGDAAVVEISLNERIIK